VRRFARASPSTSSSSRTAPSPGSAVMPATGGRWWNEPGW
jgi:hypothetical protein